MPEVRLRSTDWLQARVLELKERYFADVAKGYPIVARFGRRAVRRWGTIHADHGTSVVTINQLFRVPEVPDVVLDGTIVHELAHYAHGFGSGLRKRYKNPHAGGVVEAELERRGCLHLEQQSDAWLKEHWQSVCDRYAPDLMAVRQRKANPAWEHALASPDWRTEEALRELAARAAEAFGLQECPFPVGWLHATKRQVGMSYRQTRTGLVQLHGLLASPRIADPVLVCEIGIWIVARSGRCTTQQLNAAFRDAGLAAQWEEASRFRSKMWPKMCKAHHALW